MFCWELRVCRCDEWGWGRLLARKCIFLFRVGEEFFFGGQGGADFLLLAGGNTN